MSFEYESGTRGTIPTLESVNVVKALRARGLSEKGFLARNSFFSPAM